MFEVKKTTGTAIREFFTRNSGDIKAEVSVESSVVFTCVLRVVNGVYQGRLQQKFTVAVLQFWEFILCESR